MLLIKADEEIISVNSLQLHEHGFINVFCKGNEKKINMFIFLERLYKSLWLPQKYKPKRSIIL